MTAFWQQQRITAFNMGKSILGKKRRRKKKEGDEEKDSRMNHIHA